MFLGRNDVDVEIAGDVGFGELLDIGGAGGRGYRFALEIVDRVEPAGLLRDETGCRQEVGVGEGHLLQTFGVVGGRSTFEVDGTVGQQGNAGR